MIGSLFYGLGSARPNHQPPEAHPFRPITSLPNLQIEHFIEHTRGNEPNLHLKQLADPLGLVLFELSLRGW